MIILLKNMSKLHPLVNAGLMRNISHMNKLWNIHKYFVILFLLTLKAAPSESKKKKIFASKKKKKNNRLPLLPLSIQYLKVI